MDLLLILRDALASSVVGALLTAIDARRDGQSVGVLFTQEALAALASGSFEWPRELSGQSLRLTLARRAAALELPVAGRGEGRQLDVRGVVARAQQAGVALVACPNWTSLLDLEDRLPPELERPDAATVSVLLRNAARVIGTL